MKRGMKKGITAFSVFTMLAVLLAACSGGNGSNGGNNSGTGTANNSGDHAANEKAADPGAIDISKACSLKVLMPGEEPADIDSVLEELNKKTQQDINCTVDFKFLTWNDHISKYNLILSAGGEDYNLVFASTWLNYFSYANSGAYMALDELLPKYAPNIWKDQTPITWEKTKVPAGTGQIYMVGNEYDEFGTEGFLYREDLRKKHNLPEITSVESIEAYLEGIKANEKEMVPVAAQDTEMLYLTRAICSQGYDRIVAMGDTYFKVGEPQKLLAAYDLPNYRAAFELSKSWADKGFYAKNSYANKDDTIASFQAGKSAAKLNKNFLQSKQIIEALKVSQPEWEVKFWPYTNINPVIHPTPRIQNGYAVPKGAENAERAIMLLDKLHSDRSYYDLIVYGIQGKHYELTEDGKVDMMGFDPAQTGYGPNAGNPWGIWKNEYMREMNNGWEDFKPIFDQFQQIETDDISFGIIVDEPKIAAKVAAIAQVDSQYGRILELGLVKDMPSFLEEYVKKLKEAGNDEVLATHQKFWDDFRKAKGIE